MLPIGERIRNLRRAKNETQEDLSAVLGVTFQAVSRWENGDAYPDIELLPRLAAHFGVTTDELLGADEETRQEEREKKKRERINEIERLSKENNRKKQYETALAAFREFPEEYRFANSAAETLAHHDILPREEGLPVFRELTQKMLAQPIPTWRFFALRLIYIYEDEDRLKDWNAYVPSMIFSRQILMENRWLSGPFQDEDKAVLQKQMNLFLLLEYCLGSCFERPGNPSVSAELQDIALRMIDSLRDPSTDRDGWLFRRASKNLAKARFLFEAEKREEGYAALEKAAELYEIVYSVPASEMLDLHSAVFSEITVSPFGTAYRRGTVLEDRLNPSKYTATAEYSHMMGIMLASYFPSVTGEPRYEALADRIRSSKRRKEE